MNLIPATAADAPELAALHAAVAADLTGRFGEGHWSSGGSERGVLLAVRTSSVYLLRDKQGICGTLTLATKKPWAIDVAYFTACRRSLYLTNMAVVPSSQRGGVGRAMLEGAERIAAAFPADAIRLDAYDSPAGAGEFYARCGYRETGRVVYRRTPLIYYERLLRSER